MFLLFLKLPPMHNKTLNTFYLKKLLYKLINLNLNFYNFIKLNLKKKKIKYSGLNK